RCAGCRALVRTSLSVRTHRCPPCGLIAVRDHHAAVAIREAWVTLVIAHVLWDPVRHGLLPRGPGPAKGRESECGTVGHPGEPHPVGTAGRLLLSTARWCVALAGGTTPLPA